MLCILFQSCFISKSKINTFVEISGADQCGFPGFSYLSIDSIVNRMFYKTNNIKYYSEDGKHVKYISIALKIPHSYVFIYPDYSELSPIELPTKGKKIESFKLKKYKASRITYYLNDKIYDCIDQEYFANVTEGKLQHDNADLCKFINRPAKELLNYFNANSNNTELLYPRTYLPEIFRFYTDIKVKINELDSVLIYTDPNISLNDYDLLRENKVSLTLVEQFPIRWFEYYCHKSNKKIKINCSCQ